MNKAEIIELLKVKGWTQAELSRQLDISEATISRWIEGTRQPLGPARVLIRIWLNEAREKELV